MMLDMRVATAAAMRSMSFSEIPWLVRAFGMYTVAVHDGAGHRAESQRDGENE